MSESRIPILGALLAFAETLRFKTLFLIVLCLLALDLVIPDFIPLLDELLLGLLAIILAAWKKQRPPQLPDREHMDESDR